MSLFRVRNTHYDDVDVAADVFQHSQNLKTKQNKKQHYNFFFYIHAFYMQTKGVYSMQRKKELEKVHGHDVMGNNSVNSV